MNKEQRVKLRELKAKSTDVNQWRAHSGTDSKFPGMASVRGPFHRWLLVSGGDEKYTASLVNDANYAAAAMNDVPELLDTIDGYEKTLEDYDDVALSIKEYRDASSNGETRKLSTFEVILYDRVITILEKRQKRK